MHGLFARFLLGLYWAPGPRPTSDGSRSFSTHIQSSAAARGSAGYIYTIVGVDLEVVVDWLVRLRVQDVRKFTVLLGKHLKQALCTYPELKTEEWPI